MVAVATTADAPYSLEQLQDGLRHPVFPLYLGRKSHPLALPLAPLLLEGNACDALCGCVDKQAALDWLATQGKEVACTTGYLVIATDNSNSGGKTTRQLIQFSSVDYTGDVLRSPNPGYFCNVLARDMAKAGRSAVSNADQTQDQA